MSFQQGLSGLNAASKSLEVIGNNVSNANTVGFKQSRTEFADVYANSLIGAGTMQIGVGSKISTVAQQFTQGNITSTNNTLDLAINGAGFFQISNQGAITYTRNGQFQMDRSGYLVTSDGKRLMGYPAKSPNGATAQEIQIDTSDLQPSASTKITGQVNLDARNGLLTNAGFNPSDPTTYHNSNAVTVYDSLGNAHTIQTYFVKTATAAAPPSTTWSVFTTANGTQTTAAGVPTATLEFGSTGTKPTVRNTAGVVATPTLTFTPTTGAGAVNLTLDYGASSQFGSTFSVNKLTQDGYSSGRIASFSTGADGIITGRYTNGQSKELGRVVLSNFVNPNGLQSLGGNQWQETFASGPGTIGAPGTSTLGVLQSSSVEDSNVDLTAELVNMISAQRIYQANAQTIKTQDQVLQTLVNLK